MRFITAAFIYALKKDKKALFSCFVIIRNEKNLVFKPKSILSPFLSVLNSGKFLPI
jgi:hypothetical protein